MQIIPTNTIAFYLLINKVLLNKNTRNIIVRLIEEIYNK